VKRLTTLLLAALTLNASPAAFSAYTFDSDMWSPHIGIDYKYLGGSSTGAFEPIFPQITDGIGGYLGVRFLKHYNVDVGYERTFDFAKHTQFTAVDGSTAYFGAPDAQNDAVDINFRMKDIFLHLSYHYPFTPCFEGFVMLGLARAEPTTVISYTLAGQRRELHTRVDPQWLARWGIGVQYNFMRHLGLRAMVHREALSAFEYVGENQLNTPMIIKPYRGANVFAIGLVAFV
jgi:hypothetical protein